MEQINPVRDVEYLEALDRAVQKGVRYGIEVFAVGLEQAEPIPLDLVMQARVAARHRIPLETALRRFAVAKDHLTDLVLAEAIELGVGDLSSVRAAMAAQGAAFERLLQAAGEEYKWEARSRPSSHQAGLVERAERLLAKERVDPSPLGYELEGHHLGLFADSAKARSLVGTLAKEFGCRSLVLSPSGDELWAWLGTTRKPLDPKNVRDWIAGEGSPDLPVAVGEPGSAYEGWCLTHEQARTALWVARVREAPVVEYAEVDTLTAIRRDAVCMASLREKYLLPLAGVRNSEDLRATLRAYFRADRNARAAAAVLKVSRQTVAIRIKTVEECIGERVTECGDRLFAALTLEELGCFSELPDSLP